MVEQEGHPVLYLTVFDHVEVVEHQHHVPTHLVQVVDERGEDQVHGERRGLLQQPDRALAHAGFHRPNPRDHIGPERRRVVVAPVERQPGRGLLIGRGCWVRGQPLGDQRRLAEPGRCGDENELRLGPAVKTTGQTRTRHEPRPWPWGVELRVEHVDGQERLQGERSGRRNLMSRPTRSLATIPQVLTHSPARGFESPITKPNATQQPVSTVAAVGPTVRGSSWSEQQPGLWSRARRDPRLCDHKRCPGRVGPRLKVTESLIFAMVAGRPFWKAMR